MRIELGENNYIIETDDRNELLKAFDEYKGLNARFLNLENTYNSPGYNPLTYISEKEDAEALTECFFKFEEAYSHTSKDLLNALFMWSAEIYDPADPTGDEPELLTLIELLKCSEEPKDDLFPEVAASLDEHFNNYKKAISDTSLKSDALAFYNKFRSADDVSRISAIDNVRSVLGGFVNYTKILEKDVFNLNILHAGDTAVFILLPKEMNYEKAVLHEAFISQCKRFSKPVSENTKSFLKSTYQPDKASTLRLRLSAWDKTYDFRDSKTFAKYYEGSSDEVSALYAVNAAMTSASNYLTVVTALDKTPVPNLYRQVYEYTSMILAAPVPFIMVANDFRMKNLNEDGSFPDDKEKIPALCILTEVINSIGTMATDDVFDSELAQAIFEEYIKEAGVTDLLPFTKQMAFKGLLTSINNAQAQSLKAETDPVYIHSLYMQSEETNPYAIEYFESSTYKKYSESKDETRQTAAELMASELLVGSSVISIFANTFDHERFIREIELCPGEEKMKAMQFTWLSINKPYVLANWFNNYVDAVCKKNNLNERDARTDNELCVIPIASKQISAVLNYTDYINVLNDILDDYLSELGIKGSFTPLDYNKSYDTNGISYDFSKNSNGMKKVEKFVKEWTPAKIKAYLDEYIVGQEDAKKTISIVFWEHFYSILHPECEFKKTNIIFVGPSGVGKSELLRTLDKISPIKITFFDASGMSQDAWKGDKKVSSIIPQAINTVAMSDDAMDRMEAFNLAQKGVVFLDEMDKLIRPAYTSHNENVSVQVQGELLKLLEDGDFNVELELNTGESITTTASSKDILFICAGAFQELHEKTDEEENKTRIGFTSQVRKPAEKKYYNHDDLINFGMTPELAGRIPVVETLFKLSEDDMFNIMTNVKNSSVQKFKTSLHDEFGYDIEFDKDAYVKIVKHVIGKMGARGIQTVLFNLKKRMVYEAPVGAKIRIKDHDKFEIL